MAHNKRDKERLHLLFPHPHTPSFFFSHASHSRKDNSRTRTLYWLQAMKQLLTKNHNQERCLNQGVVSQKANTGLLQYWVHGDLSTKHTSEFNGPHYIHFTYKHPYNSHRIPHSVLIKSSTAPSSVTQKILARMLRYRQLFGPFVSMVALWVSHLTPTALLSPAW